MFVLLKGDCLKPWEAFGRVMRSESERDMLGAARSMRRDETWQVGRVLASGEVVRCWGPLPAEAS